MRRILKYVLRDGIPQLCDNLAGWAGWMDKNQDQCTIARDRVANEHGEHIVSTVFTGFDPHRDPHNARLYETLITGEGPMDCAAKRSGHEAGALKAHAEALHQLGGQVVDQDPSPPAGDPEGGDEDVGEEEETTEEEEDYGPEDEHDGTENEGDAVEEPVTDPSQAPTETDQPSDPTPEPPLGSPTDPLPGSAPAS